MYRYVERARYFFKNSALGVLIHSVRLSFRLTGVNIVFNDYMHTYYCYLHYLHMLFLVVHHVPTAYNVP